MKTYIKSIVLFFLFVSNALSVSVFYDKATNDVKCWGKIDGVQYVKENPELNVVIVKDNDPILNNPKEYLKFNTSTGKVILKSSIERNSEDSKKLKQNLKREMISLLNEESNLLRLAKEGFDVSVETTSIRNQIEVLKTQYGGL